MRIASLIAGFLGLLLSFLPTEAAERRSGVEVPLEELTRETQLMMSASPEVMDMAWYLPIEHWEAALARDRTISDEQREAILGVLESVFMIAVVQAEVSVMGTFNFFTEEEIRHGILVSYGQAHGGEELSPLAQPSRDVLLMQQTMRPMLAAAMGDLGQNLHFITYQDRSDGVRIVDPSKPGALDISLSDRSGRPRAALRLEFPLNSLFVPRRCPNGKPAHISWTFCPWDGTRLPE